MSPDEIDGVTLKCAALIREDIRLRRAGAKEQVPRSQVCYSELDVDALTETVLSTYNLRAIDPDRRYHKSETKRIWARVLTNIIRAISDAQYLLAYDKLDATGFWKEVKPTPVVLLSLQRLTRCPLFVGPSDNLRAMVSPSASGRQHLCNQADCNRYIERGRAAAPRKHKGKKTGDPAFTPHEVDPAEELGPYESASQAGSPDETESAVTRSELTKGSSTLTDRDDSGGKKTTNHVEPDFGLLWEDLTTPHYYGCPRCAVTFEAKRWCGRPNKDSSNDACIYCRIGQAADGCLFALVVHGLKFRIYQYTGRDELTAWVPDCKAASDLRYRDSYETFRSDEYMFTIGEDIRYPDDSNVGLSNLIRLLIAITVSLSNRNSRPLGLGGSYSVDLSLDKVHAIKITGVTIEAVTPRPAVRGRPVDTGSEGNRLDIGDGERGLIREELHSGRPGYEVTKRALEEQVAKDANHGATDPEEKESVNARRVESWLGSVDLGRYPADRKD
ncbi:hypothetical protein FFLO_00989 [Filobasidium floriforme]|uniref:Uncharacterized protein n=1 Tax=Filobasidium floriforme TaxID=5210 RepID=A0A8K0JRY8_9TREE|nr:hypothetical protein FFLO_00989 [Filobasidium floriforme]